MKTTSIFLLAACLTAINFTALSQSRVTGKLRDHSTGEPLPGATVTNHKSDAGTVTDLRGSFTLELEPGEHVLRMRYVGYVPVDTMIYLAEGETADLGEISMEPDLVGLGEIQILSSTAVDRKTPLPVTTIRANEIGQELGDRPYPLIMNTSPGVYASRLGGGSGDAAVNIRGFKQENIALLLNGVPISSVENGLVYWNNWTGLTDVTRQLQVQRGIGASNVAMNSVGGTINIITRTTDVEKGGSLRYEMTSYGNYKATLVLSTGRMENRWAVTFLGSRFAGPGYVDATYVDGWAYFLSASKELGRDHLLVFNIMGNPEVHGQRNFRLSQAEIDRHGIRYNKDWGSYNGEINNASENFYHKPHISLNHYWNIGKRDLLSTSVYISPGKGGGKWTDNLTGEPWIFSYYNPSGQVDWETIYDINAHHTDTFLLASGEEVTGYSKNIQTNFLASHIWGGLISNWDHEFNSRLKLKTGIHARYFHSSLKQEVRDLLGGEFYIDDYAYSLAGVAGREQIKHSGDVVKIDNGALVNLLSLFAQISYESEPVNAFVAASGANTWYRREDRYNYIDNIYSEVVTRPGFDIKAGVNYNINDYHNLYLNGGYFSRAPYFKFVFGNFNNVPTQDLVNEKVLTGELGYGLSYHKTGIRANAWITRWQDKSVLTNEYNQFEDPAMVRGLDALHKGLELEATQRVGEALRIDLWASLGEWRWKNDVTALLFNDDNAIVDTISVYADGLYVGDAPQFQLGASGNLRIMRRFEVEAQWMYFDRMYADFSPATRTDPGDSRQPYRLPSYHLLNAFVTCPFKVGHLDASAQLNCYNILDSEHIIRGQDGAGHDPDSFTGYWGFGRTFMASLKLYF